LDMGILQLLQLLSVDNWDSQQKVSIESRASIILILSANFRFSCL
jgi:hypothetical protein